MTKRTHSRLGAPPFMVGPEFALAERVKGCGLLTGMAANQKKMLIMTKRTHFVGGPPGRVSSAPVESRPPFDKLRVTII